MARLLLPHLRRYLMLTPEQQKLWAEYLQHEERGYRPAAKDALWKFIVAVEGSTLEQRSEWVFSLCRRVIDEREKLPIRFPLFERVIGPALVQGYQACVPGCARWLAGFLRQLPISSAWLEQVDTGLACPLETVPAVVREIVGR